MRDALEVIFTRQSIGDLKPDPVPRELLETILLAAVQAPNHYKVRPWRFVVLTGTAREKMGEVLAQSFAERYPHAPASALEKERAKPLRAPVIIAVGVDKPTEPRVSEIENICAAAAAVQNLLLAAHALGLAAKWRTGEDALNPHLKQFLGFAPDQHLIALVYLGYPAIEVGPANRPGFEDRTVWRE
ncbi:MAG: nitroreductase [Anaerolineales bacterium]|nr:nitroreductase [Anaerolineales bacterium]MCX7609463.1 nitroreductase [Anaerolineales bacterium]MDW8227888.1 nitroreductase [Anaerolineales bacterium]MDW8279455.1 nitroreductase [Anaerolineales bacterium]